MNIIQNTKRVFVNTLNANDVFSFPGSTCKMVCEARRSDSSRTTVTYRVWGGKERFEYTRPGLSTVDLWLD